MTVSITARSTLRSLADLIEAIDQDWPVDTTESAVNKAVAESMLLKVVGATIRDELNEIESAHRKLVHDALFEVAADLAFNDKPVSSSDQPGRSSDAQIIRSLMMPVEPAVILERVAAVCRIDAPAVVQKSMSLIRGS